MRRSYGISAIAAAAALFGMSFQAGAMAPVISELPSPIIGNEGIASPPNAFVYPDAFNLDGYVNDDTTTDGAIIWSYENAGGRYTINGVAPLDGGNPNSPGASRLDTQDNDPDQVDGNPHTITLRDTTLSPIGGPNVDPGPTTGIIANGIVTLFASDGSTNTMKEMFIYTDNGGDDRLSGGGEQVVSVDFLATAATTDWISANPFGGNVTITNVNGQGLCIQVGLTGVQQGIWISPFPFFDVAAETVYKIRLQMNDGGVPANTSPLWTIVVDNFSNDGSVIENKFAQEYIILDNVGGGSSITTRGGGFNFYFTPVPVSAADWNNPTTGMFTPSQDAINDVRVQFNVTDVDGIGYLAEQDQGRVCLESIAVEAFNINALAVDSNVFDGATIAATGFTVSNIIGGSTNVTFGGGNVTLTPVNWSVELIGVVPGNATLDVIGNPAETPDNFPIVDEDGAIYRVTMGAQAPNATGESNPPDAIRIGMDDALTEVLSTGNVLASTNLLGMPKAASVTTYTTFYNSQGVTASTVQNADRIRPRLDILNVPQVGIPAPGTNNGGITITNMTVDKMASF